MHILCMFSCHQASHKDSRVFTRLMSHDLICCDMALARFKMQLRYAKNSLSHIQFAIEIYDRTEKFVGTGLVMTF